MISSLFAGWEKSHLSVLLHRDVRPENVVMAVGGPRLTGFEVTGLSDEPPGRDLAAAVHAAPEVFDQRWDERSDLYSLASTLFQMIDGRPPFWRPGEDSIDALRLRLHHEAAPELDPDRGPEDLNRFLKAALSKDPFDRPQTAAEFAHELRHIHRRHRIGAEPSLLHATTGSRPSVSGAGSARLHTNTAPVPLVAGAGLVTPPPTLRSAPPSDGLPTEAVPVVERPKAPDTITTDGLPPAIALSAPPAMAPRPDVRADPSAAPSFVAPFSDEPAHAEAGLGPDPTGGASPTSVYGQFASDGGDGGGPARPPQADHPLSRWSPAFLVSMAMIMVGVLGLAAVMAISRLGSDDPAETVPLLPAVTDPSSLRAGEGEDGGVGEGTEAMVDDLQGATTSQPAEEMDTTTTTEPRVVVPDLVGLDVDAATRRLTDAGLGVNVIGRVIPGAQAGIVAQQTPNAGGEVTLPLSVTVYIPRTATLPPMAGKTAVAVCAELKALQVQCIQPLRHDAQIPAGIVISSTPAEGSEFQEGSSVEMIVSKGPVVDVTVPDVATMTREEAELTLMDAGLNTVGFEMEPSVDVENGRAVRTDPAAGSTLASDQPVMVYVSSGPAQQIAVPDVMGRTEADATAAVTQAGLVVAVAPLDLPAGDPGIGMVLNVDPAVGTALDAGSTVTLTVGRAMAPADAGSTTSTTAASG